MVHVHWTNDLREEVERRSMAEVFDNWSEKLGKLTAQIKFERLAAIYGFSYIERNQPCI